VTIAEEQMNKTFKIQNNDDAARLFEQLCGYLSQDGAKPVRVDLKQWRPNRSNEQNGALFGVAYKTLTQATGIPADTWHFYFCGEYFGWRERLMMDRVITEPVRTTTKDEDGNRDIISTVDMANMYEFIQARAAMGSPPVNIPDPDPKWKERMKSQPGKEET